MQLRSLAFNDGGVLPKKYTCDGSDISPPLTWSAVPERTKSLALICDDPDASQDPQVHWLLYNLPPDMAELPESIPPQKTLANGGKHGINDFKKIGYGGPCPSEGTHHYYFRLYALDLRVNLDYGASRVQLLEAMEGHILAQTHIMSAYTRVSR